jgi:hypothetical protein
MNVYKIKEIYTLQADFAQLINSKIISSFRNQATHYLYPRAKHNSVGHQNVRWSDDKLVKQGLRVRA